MGPNQGNPCHRGRWLRVVVCAAVPLVVAAGCGGSPGGPSQPPPAPAITCPTDVALSGVIGGAQAVSYPDPLTTGGTAPVNVSCMPAAGSSFPLGTSRVSCTARDGASRQASCSFAVTLAAATLSVKKFVAFGDSVTEGQNGRTIAGFRIVDVPNAYPTKLQALFDLEFPEQGISVVNRGEGGVTLERGIKDIGPILSAEHPDVLLMLHGYNDMGPCRPGDADSGECQAAINTVVNKMREGIQIAHDARYGVRYILVSTLTPPGPVGDRRRDPAAIAQANARLAQMVPMEGAALVDAAARFAGHEAEYVDDDGLHLRPAGNQALAEAFFAAIKQTVPIAALAGR